MPTLVPGKMFRPTDLAVTPDDDAVFVVEQFNHRISKWLYVPGNFNFSLADGNVTSVKLDTDAVTTDKILDANVTLEKLSSLSVDSSKLTSQAVITDKILDNNVTLSKLEADLQKGFFVINVSWETGFNNTVIKYELPFALQVDRITACVTLAIEATEDAVLIPKDQVGTAMTAGQIDLTAAAATGNSFSSSPTDNNTFIALESLQIELIKTTDGGEAQVTIHYTRI